MKNFFNVTKYPLEKIEILLFFSVSKNWNIEKSFSNSIAKVYESQFRKNKRLNFFSDKNFQFI